MFHSFKGYRSALEKCSCGVAPIRIEIGLYENVTEENRLCLLCNDNSIEDEEHVILKLCPYNDIRTDLFISARSIHLILLTLKMMINCHSF